MHRAALSQHDFSSATVRFLLLPAQAALTSQWPQSVFANMVQSPGVGAGVGGVGVGAGGVGGVGGVGIGGGVGGIG